MYSNTNFNTNDLMNVNANHQRIYECYQWLYMKDNINHHECQHWCLNKFIINDCTIFPASYYMNAKLLHIQLSSFKKCNVTLIHHDDVVKAELVQVFLIFVGRVLAFTGYYLWKQFILNESNTVEHLNEWIPLLDNNKATPLTMTQHSGILHFIQSYT